jgi:hypothetical protein
MSTFLHLGGEMVNLEHVVCVEFTDAYPGGEEQYDEDSGQNVITRPRKARLELTLTAVVAEAVSEDHTEYQGAFHLAAASKSKVITVRGQIAEDAWRFFDRHAIDPQALQEA